MENRNETPKEVQTVSPNWMAEMSEDLGNINQEISAYKKMPRLTLVQGQTKDRDLINTHGLNSAVITPGGVKLADLTTSFDFVVLYFFPQWILWSDRKDPSTPDFEDSTFNANHEIAIKAKNPETWEETYADGKFTRRYSEHLNFAAEVYMPGHPNHGQQFVMSFARSEHKTGSGLNTVLATRRDEEGKPVPYIFQVWNATVVERSNDKGTWPSLSFKNPVGDPIVNPADAPHFVSEYKALKEAKESQMLVVQDLDSGEREYNTQPQENGGSNHNDDIPF